MLTATQLRQEEDEELTLEEGAARNEPGVAVVDDQGLVHVVAQLLLHLQVITSCSTLSQKVHLCLSHSDLVVALKCNSGKPVTLYFL